MNAAAGNPRSDALRAAVWMIGAIAAFTAMAIAGRAVSFELDTFEIMMYRSMIGLLVVLIVSRSVGTHLQITRRHMSLQVARNLSHFAGQNLWFFALPLIPLAQLFALEFTAPLWALLLAPLVLGERLTRPRVIAAALGFVGILIVARPSPETLSIGVVAAAIAAIGFAGTAVFTRRLTRTQTLTCILFWMTALQSIFGLICAGYDLDIAIPSASSAPWIVVIAFAGLVAHFCLTTALSIAPATVVMPVDFARLPLIALIGMLFYNEPISIFVFLGALVIFTANYVNILLETRKSN